MRKNDHITRWLVIVAMMISLGASTGWSVTINIMPTTRLQTIDGFGCHGSMTPWWNSAPFYNQAFLDLVIDDFGLTINRNEFYPPSDGNIFDAKQTPWIKALAAKAKASGEPLKFITSYWTPPANMKDNNATVGGGSLKPDQYAAFGQYAVSTVNKYKAIGIDLYAMSLQNEPMFVEPYNSCVYTVDTYRDMLKVVGPIIRAAHPNVKIFGAEHMSWALEWDATSYERTLAKDPEAKKYLDIAAFHGYSNGVNPQPAVVTAIRTVGALFGGKIWMTETSGYDEGWTSSFQLAQDILGALKYGRLTGWVWWQMSEPGMSNYVLMDLGKPGKRYAVHKNFYRFIRPGAVQVSTTSNDAEVEVAAFKHDSMNTLVFVCTNKGTAVKSVTFSGTGIPTVFDVYRTSSSENCVKQGGVASTAISLAPGSITTIVSGNVYGTPVGIRRGVAVGRHPSGFTDMNNARMVTLDGRLVKLGRATSNDAFAGRMVVRQISSKDGTLGAYRLVPAGR